MSKIREIIEKYAEHIEQTTKFAKFKSITKLISSDDFDKLEKELQEYIRDYIEEVVWEIEMGEDA